jgi:protein TonB
MKLFQPNRDNLDEIVFENRNQLYGAYDLRKSYDENLLKASASSFLLLGLFISVAYAASLYKPDIKPMIPALAPASYSSSTISKIEIILDDMSTALSMRSDNNLHYRIVRDQEARTIVDRGNPEIPLNPQGNEQQGVGGGEPGPGGVGDPGGEPGGPVFSEPPVVEPEVVAMVADVMPAFPGGQDKLKEYLIKNLRYPENAMRMGVEGRVILSFVVGNDGDVTDIKIERTLGFGCDDEAIRVVSAMPKWSAGIEKGKKLPVKMILPIQFRLQ